MAPPGVSSSPSPPSPSNGSHFAAEVLDPAAFVVSVPALVEAGFSVDDAVAGLGVDGRLALRDAGLALDGVFDPALVAGFAGGFAGVGLGFGVFEPPSPVTLMPTFFGGGFFSIGFSAGGGGRTGGRAGGRANSSSDISSSLIELKSEDSLDDTLFGGGLGGLA